MEDLIGTLLSLEEGEQFECKRARIKPSDALVPIVAMANAQGGLFVLGLEDPKKEKGRRRLYGMSENPDNVGELRTLISREITPPLPQGTLESHDVPIVNNKGREDQLSIFVIEKSPHVHSLRWGVTYLRVQKRNTKLTAEQIMRLKYSKGEVKIEDEPATRVRFSELDLSLVDTFQKAIGSQEKDASILLKKSGLACEYEGRLVPNKAGVLLFSENPSIALRGKYGVKISVYYGREPYYSGEPNLAEKPVTIEGPVLKQIYDTLAYVKGWLRKGPRLREAGFLEEYRLPDYALQEAITNAVIHRDYAIQNDIQVRIFDNRVEVESPGGLPGHITLTNIQRERFARNPIVLRTLNRMPNSPNLDIGEGVKRIFESMKSSDLIDPVYAVEENFVKISLFNERRTPYWERAEEFLKKYGKITNRDLRQMTGIQDTVRISRILKNWVDHGLLIKMGTSKKGRYYVKGLTLLLKDALNMFSDVRAKREPVL